MSKKQISIVFHAGKDAWHFERARAQVPEKEHLAAIADEMYRTGKYNSYSAAMAAATGVYDYQVSLGEGHLINRAARQALRSGAAPDGVQPSPQ